MKVPDVPEPPVPVDDEHELLLVEVQETVVLPPEAMEFAPTATVTVGAGGTTVIVWVWLVDPPAPTQVTV